MDFIACCDLITMEVTHDLEIYCCLCSTSHYFISALQIPTLGIEDLQLPLVKSVIYKGRKLKCLGVEEAHF